MLFFTFAGTLIATIFLDWQLWFCTAIFVITRWGGYSDKIPFFDFDVLPKLLNGSVGLCSKLTVFLTVYYVFLCFKRYTTLYDLACASAGRILDSCTIARKFMSKAGSWRVFRLMNAAHLLAYVGVDGAYHEGNLFTPLNDKYNLLVQKELERLQQVGFPSADAHREVISWLMQLLKTEAGNGQLTEKQLKGLSTQFLTFRGSLARFYHFAALPLPFPFVHAINFQVFLFLPVYAFTLGYSYNPTKGGKDLPGSIILTDSIIQFLYLFWYAATILSLRTLGQRLQDPFGHNLEDLSVLRFIDAAVMASGKILCAPVGHKSSEQEESQLFFSRPALGIHFSFQHWRRQVKQQSKVAGSKFQTKQASPSAYLKKQQMEQEKASKALEVALSKTEMNFPRVDNGASEVRTNGTVALVPDPSLNDSQKKKKKGFFVCGR